MVTSQTIKSDSVEDTIEVAQQCAHKAQAGDIYALYGPLGAGKSIFARAFIQKLCGEDTDVPSPTFTLVQTYERHNSQTPIWHFDLYRLEQAEEVYEIGWEDDLDTRITLVEWPERLDALLPSDHIEIKFEEIIGESRRISYIDHKEGRQNG